MALQKKRPNHSGSVFQRADGRWVAAATVDGKRVFRYRQSRQQAELALANLLSGAVPPSSKRKQPLTTSPTKSQATAPECQCADGVTLRQWVEEWLLACSLRLRPSTFHAYRKAIARVLPLIGDVHLSDLTRPLLTNLVQRLTSHGPRAAQESYTVLRTCLQAAVDDDLFIANPMTRIPKPKWQPVNDVARMPLKRGPARF